MASFYGASIIFDDVPSETYDLRILSFDAGGVSDGNAGANVEIYSKTIYRKPKPYFYGVSVNKPLEFDITLGSANPISGMNRDLISRWLLGQRTYKKLQIVQDDIADTYFNVIFVSATNKYVGNVQYGITLHAICDAPWGFTYPKTISYTFTGNNFVSFDFDLYNDGADADYNYPYVEFTLNGVGSTYGFNMYNLDDGNRRFGFNGLGANEKITVDNYLQVITSSTGQYRLNCMYNTVSPYVKNWFRLVPGINHLTVSAGIGNFKLIYSFARKIGG
jgi:hypothetical protein